MVRSLEPCGLALRVASLLPSATETLLALGVKPCAVSHSCDFPEVVGAPVVTSTVIDSNQAPVDIDRQVNEQDEPLYRLDLDRLTELAPDVVVTQTVCRVCAIDGRDLDPGAMPGRLVNMDAMSLHDLPEDFLRLGEAVGRLSAAEELVAEWNARLQALPLPSGRRPRVAFLEWLEPPFSPGHWVPEMIALAGGIDVLGQSRRPARRLTWEDVDASQPDMIIAAPCGYTPGEIASLVKPGMIPAGARFDRPGPGLIDSLEWMADVIQRQSASN